MTCFRRRPLAQRLPLKLLGTSTRSCFAVQDVVNTVYITSYHKDESFGRAQAPSTELNLLTHQTGNYPVTCFVSRPSGITLVKFSPRRDSNSPTNTINSINSTIRGLPLSIDHRGDTLIRVGSLVPNKSVFTSLWYEYGTSVSGTNYNGVQTKKHVPIHSSTNLYTAALQWCRVSTVRYYQVIVVYRYIRQV